MSNTKSEYNFIYCKDKNIAGQLMKSYTLIKHNEQGFYFDSKPKNNYISFYHFKDQVILTNNITF